MVTIADRRKIAKLILTTRDESTIEKIKKLLSGSKITDEYIKKYNKEIDAAIERVRNGKFYSGEQADTLLEEWAKK